MSQRLPVNVTAEFRGSKPASTFVKRETGEVIPIPEKLRFEFETGEGPDLLEIAISALDKVSPPFDAKSLSKGDEVEITGVVVVPEKGSDRDAFFACTGCKLVKDSKLKAA
jgi:hypothetical protein